MTIFERVDAALATLSPAVPYGMGVYLSATGESLPDVYLTYKLISAPPEGHADDAETLRGYRVQVNVFSRSGLVGLPAVEAAMKAAGFMRAGSRMLNYEESSEHHGLAMDFTFLEDL